MSAPVSARRRFGPPVLMGGGLAMVGAAGYAFLALSGHTLSTGDAAAVASLYLLINIIGPGVFSALEQETSRTISAGAAGAAFRRRAARAGAGLLAVVVVLLLAASPVLVPAAFGGRSALLVALILGSATSAAVYLVRGLLGGQRRFGGYAATLAAEGLGRLLPCVLVAVFAAPGGAVYGLLFAAGSAFGALAGLPVLRGGAALPVGEPSPTGMTRAIYVLVGSTLLAQLVANLGPVVVSGRLTADTATAAAFASAFVLVRIPLFVFAPVQAMLLPTLTAAATRGDFADFRRKLRLILSLVAAAGFVGVVLSFTLGSWAVRVFFGARVALPGNVLGLLALGTIALMVAQVLQPALVATGLHRAATVSWAVGSAVLTGLLFLPGSPLWAAVTAQIAGSVLVVAGMTVALVRAQSGKKR